MFIVVVVVVARRRAFLQQADLTLPHSMISSGTDAMQYLMGAWKNPTNPYTDRLMGLFEH